MAARGAGEKRLAEADGKALDFDAAPARHQQVSELVKADEKQDGKQKRCQSLEKGQIVSLIKDKRRFSLRRSP